MVKAKQTKDQKRKEVLRLWWEYLKRSDIYKEYCELSREDDNKDFQKQFRFTVKEDAFKKMFKTDLHHMRTYLAFNSYHFGDVHLNSFENWWRHYRKEERTKVKKDVKSVERYNIGQEMDLFIDSFKKGHRREPTLQEFREDFLYQTNSGRDYYLKIDLFASETTNDLIKQIGKIIRKRRKAPVLHKRLHIFNLKPFSDTTHRNYSLRVDELKRYLQVYDLDKEGLSMSDIIEKMGKNSKDTDIRSIFHQDLKRAKKIIKNVESSCVFPGKYQPKDRN